MHWARGIRIDRIGTAAEAVAKSGRRWQTAALLNPEAFSRAQGLQSGTPVVRAGLDPDVLRAGQDLFEALTARAMLRGLAHCPDASSEVVTLHPWTEGIHLPPARWGGKYRQQLPDERIAVPLDAGLWMDLFDDPIRGRDAWKIWRTQLQRCRNAAEPLDRLLLLSWAVRGWSLPEEWRDDSFAPARVYVREAVAALVRHVLGDDDPGHVLFAETLASRLADPEPVSPVVLQALGGEFRIWKQRATPPLQAIDPWAERLSGTPAEALEAAYEQSVIDKAAVAVMRALVERDIATEIGDQDFLRAVPGDAGAQPLMPLLEKLAPATWAEIQQERKERSGRLKGKQRRKLGARWLAKTALLHALDTWFDEWFAESAAHVEVSEDEPARLQEEAQRGGLYLFGAAETSAPAAAHAVEAVEQVGFRTGHLFADLKGFTALTSALRESEIRQFLRVNFYEPLLRLAKEYFKGGVELEDRGGIRLNNLLGDAISLSGDPLDLLEFAERASDLVQDGIGELIRESVQAQQVASEEQARLQIESALHRLRVQKARGEGDPQALDREIRTLQAKLTELGGDLDEVISLEFGFFVSFGAAPIDLTIQDDVFGDVYVALADKINESARGVERNGLVQAALKSFAQKYPGRPWAFRIHVGPVIEGAMPEELLDAWPTDPEEADMIAKSMPDSIRFRGGTSMYNVGIGLSPETVVEVCKALEADDVRVLDVRTPELLKRLDRRYLMPEPKQYFIEVPWRDGGSRLLRRCGRVEMKGFSRPPMVWEWVGPWMPVFDALSGVVATQGETRPWLQAVRAAG